MIAGVLLAALAPAGCGSASEGGGRATPPPNSSPSDVGATAVVPTTPAATSAAPTAAPTAADGTTYAACRDGNCEVAVSEPVEIRLRGSGVLAVRKVLPDGVDFDMTLASGASSNGTLKGNCTLTFTDGGGGSSCSAGPVGPPKPRSGTTALQLVSVTDGVIILRLVTG
ncbi:hypothetical protein BDK92_7433 [Micromonospora pisi]|uniref:Uncharacterized protein n=1 Tax=Micromonospora pisi TaxID=589240 RepID=A0A495JXF1_9ACTN|nr:hypothetical protein BDK92_7433 [Micromonospora pisi]